MSRTDRWAGLSPRAEELVEGLSAEFAGTHEGVFGNTYHLRRWHLADGLWVREGVQADVWAGGPTFFMALEVEGADHFFPGTGWTDQEMADYIGFQVGDALPALTDHDDHLFGQFEEAILDGSMRLTGALQSKFTRWREERTSARVQPTS